MCIRDSCYYHYMDGDGYPSKLIVDEEGKVRNEYIEDDGSASIGDYDMVPFIDRFVEKPVSYTHLDVYKRQGMQRRGRMAEVSGGLVLGVVFLLLFLCVGQSRISYLKEMIAASSLAGKDIMRSLYGFLCAFSGISLLPFVLKEVEKRSTVGRPIVLGIFTLGGSLMGMLILLPAVLGWQRLKSEAYPVLPLLCLLYTSRCV